MKELIISFDNPFYQGLVVFFTLVSFLIIFYKHITNEITRECHKQWLLSKLSLFSSLNIKEIGVKSSLLFNSLLNRWLGNPEKIYFSDFTLWSERPIRRLLLLNLITLGIAGFDYIRYFIHGPALFCTFIFSSFTYEDNLKKKGKKSKTHKFILSNSNYYIWEFIESFLPFYCFFLILRIIFFIAYRPLSEFFHVLYFHAGIYVLHTCLLLISINISRILLFKISIYRSIRNTLKLILFDILIAFLISLISFMLSYVLLYFSINYNVLEITSASFKASKISDAAKLRYFFSSFLLPLLPSFFFLIIALFELTLRLFFAPIQIAIVFIFEKIIKYNYHIFITASLIILLLAALLNKYLLS